MVKRKSSIRKKFSSYRKRSLKKNRIRNRKFKRGSTVKKKLFKEYTKKVGSK